MANFTPLKFEKGKIKKIKNINVFNNKKFLLVGNLFLVILIIVFGGFYYYKMLVTKQKAVGVSCKTITKQNECNNSCSPPKGPKNIQYRCKWVNGECKESSKSCDEKEKKDPYECPSGTYKSGCKDHFDSSINKWICDCYLNNTPPGCNEYGYSICYFKSKGRCDSTYICDKPKLQSLPTNTLTPTSQLTNTPTPTIIITNLPTPTSNPTPTDISELNITLTSTPTPTTPPNQPTNTPIPTNTPTPTEIIVVQSTNTPVINSPTNTPIQQIAETGNVKSLLIFSIPIGIILLGLLL